MTIREHKHRLILENYRGRVRVAFALCVEGRKLLFTNAEVCDIFLGILREMGTKHDCLNWVYVFMPDHVHLIMEGKNEDTDLWKMIVEFKQKTGFWLSRNCQDISWQKSFYDHLLRTEDELKRQIIYVLDNPVRKKIVHEWREYKYSGSLDFDRNDLLQI